MSFVGGLKDTAMGGFDKILEFPDTFEKPWQKKAMYILYDLGLLLFVAGMGAMTFTMGGGSLLNPNFMTLMSLPMLAAGAGMGGAFLLEDILPKSSHREVGKVMSIACPILIAASAVGLMMLGIKTPAGHLSFTQTMQNPYFGIGAMTFGLSVYVAKNIPDKFAKRIPYVKGELPPEPHWRERLQLQSNPEYARGHLDRLELDEERRRIHEEGNWFTRLFRRPAPSVSTAEDLHDTL